MSKSCNFSHGESGESEPTGSDFDPQISCRTYFLSGFDPRGAAYYKRLFQTELRPSGWRLGKRFKDGLITRWPLNQLAVVDEQSSSDLCFLHWDDIAQANWPRSPLLLLWQCSVFAWWYLLKGGLLHYAGLCPGVALCGAYPLLYIVFAFCCAGAAAGLTIAGLSMLAIVYQVQVLSSALVALGVLFFTWRLANRLGVVWLARSIVFTHRLGQLRDSDLRQRVKELADELLLLEVKKPALEITLVGHSSGSFVLTMLAAELHRRPNAASVLSRIKLLTLGQNLANLAVYPGAQLFRDDLQELTTEPRIPWRDVTSTQDLLCFAGVNPYVSCGLPEPPGEPYPKMELIDLAIQRGYTRRRDLLGNQFDLHFDYLRNHCSGVRLPALLAKGMSSI